MSRIVTVFAVVVALAALAVSSPGLPAAAAMQPATPLATPAPGQPITVPVDVHDMKVTPAQTVFRAGQAYRFVITNTGASTHEFVIEPAGAVDKALEANGKEAEAEDIAPGQTKELIWTFDKASDFQVACHKPGHYEAGMVHPIQVVDNAVVVPVEEDDFYVKLGQTEFKPGTWYAFVITNAGQNVHEGVLEKAGVVDEALETEGEPEREAEAEDIAPGHVRELIWKIAAPGDYQFACHKPGHYEAGMVQPFTVK